MVKFKYVGTAEFAELFCLVLLPLHNFTIVRVIQTYCQFETQANQPLTSILNKLITQQNDLCISHLDHGAIHHSFDDAVLPQNHQVYQGHVCNSSTQEFK